MWNKLFSVVIVLLLVLGISLLNRKEEILVLENRKASVIDNVDIETSFLNGELVSELGSVLSDQCYYRDDLINYYYAYKINANYLFGDEQKIVISDEITLLEDGYLIRNLNDIDWESAINSARDRGYNFRRVYDSFPGVKAYVYVPTNVVETSLVDDDKYTSRFEELDKAFISQTRSDIPFKRLELNTIEDFEKYYYKYDIHWTIDGAYQGYVDIIDMINDDFDIGEPRTILSRVTSKLGFKGSDARKIGNAVKGYDHISDIDLGISEDDYELYIDGVLTNLRTSKAEYLENGSKNQEAGEDYLEYYGELGLIKEYDFHQEDKPNILIFTDSFSNPIQEAIASHFNETVFVDLRFNNDNEFDTYEIMENYQIDIILMLEYYEDLYLNGYCYIPINY